MKRILAHLFFIHFLLLPVFFVWHIVNANTGLIPHHYIFGYLSYYLLLATGVFLLSWLLFRNPIKAACFDTCCLLVFFLWGATHDWLKSVIPVPVLTSYSFLFSATAAVLLTVFIVLIRKPAPARLNRFLFITFFVLNGIELVTTIFHSISGAYPRNNLLVDSKLPVLSDSAKDKPDIFVFVFDELTSSPALKKYLGFDNSGTDSLLLSAGFYLSPASAGNYNSTVHSLSALLSMQYLRIDTAAGDLRAKDFLRAQLTLKQSHVPLMLKQQGYDIINDGIFDLQDHPSINESASNAFIVSALFSETLLARIEHHLWWNGNLGMRKTLSRKIEEEIYTPDSIIKRFSSALGEMKKNTVAPRFLISQLMLTHTPYLFLRDGQQRVRHYPLDREPAVKDSLYLEQVRLANKWIQQIAQAASQPSARPKIVVVMGDHGYRDENALDGIREKQLMNFNAIYFSDRDYHSLYDGITPVNQFRIILNKYFGQQFPLLKDSSVLLTYKF